MADLPAGIVTFLFTDIEGSTARWDQQTEPMRAALARHDALLHDAIGRHSGVVFKTWGDAFCAAFASAPDALAAAVGGQRALQNERFDEVGRLPVRMALHTGLAQQRDDDYFGPPLNRVARLLAAG
jgi:class 3 adenylate cyclase